ESLNGCGRLEIELKLEQFSKQWISCHDLSNSEIYSELNLESFTESTNVIKDLAELGYFGKIVKYQDVFGYDPERIRQIVQKYCTQELGESPSEILGVCDMGEYGSGGMPERFTDPFRISYGLFNSAR
ncbi:hypothetical protein BGZ58_002857, partial [Dissophora ornata]